MSARGKSKGRAYDPEENPFKHSDEFEGGGAAVSTRRKSSSGGGRKSRGGGSSSRKEDAPVERNGPGEVRKEAYFFVKKKQTHLAALDGDEDQDELPPDFWSRPVANFQTLEEAQEALDHPKLLRSFFTRMQEMLSLIEANNSTSDFNTQLAREMIDTCTATIFCYGETGAGKSSLIRNLTGDPNAVSSHTTPGTFADTHCLFKSGLRFIDTAGFNVPLMPKTTLGLLNAEWFREYLQWEKLLKSVKARMASNVVTERPLAICYVHRATHRIIPERIAQLVSIPHMRMVPVFLIVTDVYGVEDEALHEVRSTFRSIVKMVGFNGRGKSVHLLEVNSQAKSVDKHLFKSTGLEQLASLLLNALEPMDALTFCNRSFMGIGGNPHKRRKLET